jgi:hypothetical protein
MKSDVSKHEQHGTLEPADLGGARRRRDRRYSSSRRVEILPCNATADWKFFGVELLDCSRRGMGLISSQAFTPGQQFLAKLKAGKRTVLLIYTVRHCAAKGHKYRLGAEFSGLTAAPSQEDLDRILVSLRCITSHES